MGEFGTGSDSYADTMLFLPFWVGRPLVLTIGCFDNFMSLHDTPSCHVQHIR
jgi:hypothetical protein